MNNELSEEIDFIVKNKNRYDIQAVSLFDLLTKVGGEQKRIPAYQRPYSWDKGNVSDLMNDLLRSFERNNESKKWFTGMIFTCQEDTYDRTVDLLDGQQRITTLMLLFRAIYLFPFWYGEERFEHFKERLNRSESAVKSDDERKADSLKAYEEAQEKLEHCMKVKIDDGRKLVDKSRFLTGGALEDLFNAFILNTFNTNYDNARVYDAIKVTGSEPLGPTLARLNENYTTIKDILEGWVEGHPDAKNKLSNLKDLARFVDHILYDIILINIPLYEKNSVLEIFESLNNRGKSLSLTDIIRFKSLKAYAKDPDKLKEMEEKWGDIYEIVDRISSSKSGGYNKAIFPTTRVFLERFINSFSEKDGGFTDNKSRIEAFMKRYGSNLETGTKEIKDVLERLEYTLFLDAGKSLFKDAPARIKPQVRAVVQTLNLALRVSETSQVAFFGYLNHGFKSKANSSPGETYFKTVCDDLIEIIKSVFFINVAENTRSNISRNTYIIMAKSFYKAPGEEYAPLTYKNFEHRKYQNGSKALPSSKIRRSSEALKNVLFNTDNEESKFILSLYQCITEMNNMPSRGDFKEEELEHIIPEKWYNNLGWRTSLSPEKFENIVDASPISNDIKAVFKSLCTGDEFLSKRAYAKTFVQIIGNKCVLYKHNNIALKNKYWEDHDSNGKNPAGKHSLLNKEVGQSNFMIMPTSPYLLDYKSFHLEQAIERSAIVAEAIFKGLDRLEFKL